MSVQISLTDREVTALYSLVAGQLADISYEDDGLVEALERIEAKLIRATPRRRYHPMSPRWDAPARMNSQEPSDG